VSSAGSPAVVTSLPASAVAGVTLAPGTAVQEAVRNGVEHNDRAAPRAEVTVVECLGGDSLDVRVADDGPGIDQDQAETAGATGETDRKTRHLDGLGLWTVRLVLQHGGTPELEPNEPRSTVVVLRVPRVEVPADAAAQTSD
jgi:anti-sigma regulatory factor (Ser/Thr protein kinase)